MVGKNYDWHLEHGYALVNKRGMKKQAMQIVPNQTVVGWTSKYGSLTFNQYGRELPNGGMNEKGLVVEVLWLDETVYPLADKRPSINELQWVQYHLDNFSSVKEALAGISNIRIEKAYANVHFILCDRTGECATVEYLKGNLVVHNPANLKQNILTNNTQEESAIFLARHIGFGGTLPIPTGTRSLERYVRVADQLKTLPAATPEKVLQILEMVRQGAYTKWSIAYDTKERTVSFRTLTNPAVRTSRTDFDYSCKTPVLGVSLDNTESGDLTKSFVTFSDEMNRAMIDTSFATLGEIGKKLSSSVANYPGKTVCTE